MRRRHITIEAVEAPMPDPDSDLTQAALRVQHRTVTLDEPTTYTGYQTPITDGQATVIVTEGGGLQGPHLECMHNAGQGLFIERGGHVKLERYRAEGNGWNGLACWRTKDLRIGHLVLLGNGQAFFEDENGDDPSPLYTTNTTNKLHNLHTARFGTVEADHNYHCDLWFDEDCSDIVIDDIEVGRVVIEACQGPLVFERGRIGELHLWNAEQITLGADLDVGAIIIKTRPPDDPSGIGYREVQDWETGETLRLVGGRVTCYQKHLDVMDFSDVSPAYKAAFLASCTVVDADRPVEPPVEPPVDPPPPDLHAEILHNRAILEQILDRVDNIGSETADVLADRLTAHTDRPSASGVTLRKRD